MMMDTILHVLQDSIPELFQQEMNKKIIVFRVLLKNVLRCALMNTTLLHTTDTDRKVQEESREELH